MRRLPKELLISLVLVAATLAAFWPIVYCGFVNYDDGDYVADNPRVKAGLTRDSVRWALTTTHAANWHPLTWLSLQLDVTLFGVTERAFHLVNLALHCASSVILFLALRFMTGAVWRSSLVAALFALHPLHVESVAWVAERKDVLSTLFWMLTLLAYAVYAARPSVIRYLLIVVAFALGLAAKPMLVTLPCVLLLLDYWPLRRFSVGQPAPSDWSDGNVGAINVADLRRSLGWLLIEKLPLFVLSGVCCWLTLQAQRVAVSSLDKLPLSDRLANIVTSYGGYLAATVRPQNLCILYPHPFGDLPAWKPITSCIVLLVVSGLAFWCRQRQAFILVGWFWYLGTLVPVIGLIQVGEQAMADRYTYVPLVGIFLALAWGLPTLLSACRVRPTALAFPALLLLLACAIATRAQVWHWRTSIDLWEHALKVTANNATAHNNLGGALMNEGRNDEAADHFVLALQMRRGLNANASHNLGVISARRGDLEGAADYYLQALKAEPNHAVSLNNLGLVQSWQGKPDKALACFCSAVQLQPTVAKYRFHLACALQMEGAMAAARGEYDEGMRLDPAWVDVIDRSAWQMATHGPTDRNQMAEALTQATEACQATDDQRAEFLDTLAAVYAASDRFEDALPTARRALKLATATGRLDQAARIEERLWLYEQRKPFREKGD